MGVVCSIEYFKLFLFHKPFSVITDHRAFLYIMRENRANKSYISRLTCWGDGLLPFNFSIDYLPGSKIGLVDYIWMNLDGLYEVLAPGSSVIKSNEHTSIIVETGKKEVTIRNSDLAKLGTKAERQSDLKCYANWRPKVPTDKITEDLIKQHPKEVRTELEGNKKIKHKIIADNKSAVSSIHSNVSRALRVRMPTKPKKKIIPEPPQPPIELVTDFAPPLVLPQTSIVIAEPRPKRKAATKAIEALQPTQKSKRWSASMTEPDKSLASAQICPPFFIINVSTLKTKEAADDKTTTDSK